MQIQIPLTRDLVLIGGGHAHALVLRMWGMNPLPGVRVTLIDPNPAAPYTGMLPGHVAGHYRREELDIDLVRLARFAGARLILGAATAIDPQARTVSVAGRGQIAWDVASIDVGIHGRIPGIAGFDEHAVAAKPLDIFADRWRTYLASVAAGDVPAEAAVIGGGVAGAELSLAMAFALREVARATPKLTLIEAGQDLLSATPSARRGLAAAMERLGVTAITGAEVAGVRQDGVTLADGRHVPSRFTVGAAGAYAHPWLAQTGLPVTEDGFVRAGADLRVVGQDSLFAVGDCAHLDAAPRPKAGVFAVRAAKPLLDNLRAVLSGRETRPFHPQRHYLKLISLGDKSAIAEKWGRSVAHPVLWRWKDRIDRAFMEKFQTFPEMRQSSLPAEVAASVIETLGERSDPLCGGCGSKVAPGALGAVLDALDQPGRADVLSGPGDDAAVLDTGGVRQVLTTDHLRAFTDDPGLMARITAVHALGDIWAMGAAPQAALVSVILPRMSEALQARTMSEIMQAAGAVLGAAGAEIVGGHSTMGAEMTIGFSITGLLDGAAITHGGARPGDALILTRPIGTGTLLAGEMQGKARGRDVAWVLAAMARPQDDAARILSDAHAMTDVTGFGLAGHLMAICRASKLAAKINLDAVPLYDGALDLAEAGIRSTIWAANRAAAPVAGAEGARGALLHDPQTSGGLLAAVDPDAARPLVASLRNAGHAAAVVGRLETGPPSIRSGSD
ncbi:selenide, water dikinase SelD [Sulfitobacter sp. D35]|uniref:selenide, water dikinase SelD n=1 Tax=Sulfitobacter sp. D35 TaxID=3083252 RepID=UPI00296EEA56|nr:selenide, water dikinase SelD [Sulfitobacter sp. D35]MDW4496685.1 selenide, water dikinase SelD [Sulfitobacter sp. D35]